jgi:hypothetical protein
MSHMTQTQTPAGETPDPDRHPDPDSGLDQTQTRTGPGRYPDRHPDPDPDRRPDQSPGPGPGPDDTRTQTQTPAQTQTPDPSPGTSGGRHSAGPGPDDTRTQTDQTQTQTDRTLHDELRRSGVARPPTYPGGWLARTRSARAARRAATAEAIAIGAEAELAMLERRALGDLHLEEEGEDPPARWERFAAGWPQWVLTAVVSVMASVGQIEFAKKNGATKMIWLFGHDITPWFAPAVFDLSVAGLYALGMYVAVRYKASPWLPWAAGSAIGAVSVYTNTQHRGALFFATASGVLLVSWLVRMIVKYQHLAHVKVRRASAKPRLLTSSLAIASLPTAARAWKIARRRPVSAIAYQMKKRGDPITERDLVIRAAELWLTVHADRVVAELRAVGDPPSPKDKATTKAWRVLRAQALRQAEIVAWDAVDDLFGIRVIQREGIRVNRVTYLEPQPEVQMRTAPPVAFAAAPAAPAQIEASTTSAISAPPRRRPAITAAAFDEDEPNVILVPGRPGGNAGKNWLPLDEFSNLPDIDPSYMCRCHPKEEKWCGKTLVFHIQRRGQYLAEVMRQVADWDTRIAKIGKAEIIQLLDLTSDGLAMDLGWVLEQIRRIAQEQLAGKNTAASAVTTVESAEVPES